VLDGLVEAARPGRADRGIRGAGVVERERAEHLLGALAQRAAEERGAPQRREQKRDAEVRVRPGDAAGRAHRREDGVADAPFRRAPDLGPQRDRAAQHVLVGRVREVVTGRDVAGLLGARLEDARELRRAGHRFCAPAASCRRVRAAATRLLDRHSRHRIACRPARDRVLPTVAGGRGRVSTTTEERAYGFVQCR
jgi:hypothetical protein